MNVHVTIKRYIGRDVGIGFSSIFCKNRLHILRKYVSGWDSVDDKSEDIHNESKV